MKTFVTSLAAAVIALGLAGCQGEMTVVSTLESGVATSQPLTRTQAVAKKGTYYLYSSKDPEKPIYWTDLKRGEELGFRVIGNRVDATAKGILIGLPDYSEGASYEWKLEEKKE